MNTVLHLAHGALSYYGGKKVGLWGLVGLGLAFLVVATWNDLFQPVVEFLKLDVLADSLGLVHEGATHMTVYKIFMALFFLSIILLISGFLFAVIAGGVVGMMESNVGTKIILSLLAIIFSPVLLVAGILVLFGNIREQRQKRKDPTAYAERKRLAKNDKVIKTLMYEGVDDGKDNVLSYEEAFNRLNRLPTEGDYLFLLGITHERDIYMLFPRAIMIRGYKPGMIMCQKLNISFDKNRTDNSLSVEILEDNLANTVLSMPTLDLKGFELFITPSNHKKLMRVFEGYTLSSSFYKEYVNFIQNNFFRYKERLIEKLLQAHENEEYEEYNHVLEEYQTCNVTNEDVVKMICEGNKQAKSV